jgi:post-segregation antitoxin (ccd killing protein)
VKGLDQRYPDKAAQLSLLGSLGDFSRVKVEGEMTPFAEHLGLNLTGDIKAVPLPSVSPYSEAYIGYHLTRGQYDHEFDIKIENNNVEFNNKLLLRQLKLKSVDPSKPQPVAKQLDVPLGFALNMLRDGEDNIHLDVPIKGRLDDPNINVSKVINKALANALKSGATNYLSYALQPYGAVFMAASMVGDRLSSIRLEAIEYPAGQAGLSAEQQLYLGKVSELLSTRPKLSLTACATTNEEDHQALQAFNPKVPVEHTALVELARQRSIQVKQALLEKGISSERVFLCQPEFVADGVRGVTMAM